MLLSLMVRPSFLIWILARAAAETRPTDWRGDALKVICEIDDVAHKNSGNILTATFCGL
jgi:hypothetical protein